MGGEDVSCGDPTLEFSPLRPRPRGQPRKKRGVKRDSEGGPRRPRGRPKKVVCEDVVCSPRGGPPSPFGPYFTRARKPYFIGKQEGLEFLYNEEEAIRGLAMRTRCT